MALTILQKGFILLKDRRAAEFSENAVVLVFVVVAAIGVLQALGFNITAAIGSAAAAI
jgi:small-conductance mechanosensitive channel